MSPADFCPFSVPCPQVHFDGCPLFADGESRAWTLAKLKERLLQIGTLYLQCNHEVQSGPRYEQSHSLGTREAHLAHFIQTFKAVRDSDQFRTAVRVKYRGDLTASLVDDIVTDLASATNGKLTVAAAEKLTLGVAAYKLYPPRAPIGRLASGFTPPAGPSSSANGPCPADTPSLADLTARAAAAYARTEGRFQLIACAVKKHKPGSAADRGGGLQFRRVSPDDPNCWRLVGSTAHMPFSSPHYLGSASINAAATHHLILGAAPGTASREEFFSFIEFAKSAGAFLRTNPPPGTSGGGGMSAAQLWALLLLFWTPCAGNAVARVGAFRVVDQPWGASLIALRALGLVLNPSDESNTSGDGEQSDPPWPEYMTANDLADRLGLQREATRKKLERLADRIDCRREVESPRKGEARWTYRTKSVLPELRGG